MQDLFRSKIRNVALDILSSFSKPKPGIHILNGHFLSLDNTLSGEIFHHLINKLQENGVVLINFNEAVARISKRDVNTDKCYVAFTFDDGFEECFTKIGSVLNHFKVKAGFFINPGFTEGDKNYRKKFLSEIVLTYSDKKPMTWNMIKELHEQGHTIGSHTMDHCKLTGFDKNYEYQILEAQKVIEQKLNSPCEYFAYTYGKILDFSNEALRIAESKYKYIFSQDDYQNYFSFNGKVINRRHFECDWNYKHVLYFLKAKKLSA